MAKREHGYIALVPVFIPVPKNDLPNQIAAATALHEATRSGSLDQIMGLPGVRLHVKPGKDIVNRWTSVERVEAGEAEQTAEEEPTPDLLATMDQSVDGPDLDGATAVQDPSQGEATTTGRRRRAAA